MSRATSINSPRFPARPGALGPAAGYWPNTVRLVYALLAVLAVRLHEFVPLVSAIKPALLLTIVATFLLASHSSPSAIRSALRDPLTRLLIAYLVWCAATIPMALWGALAFSIWRGMVVTVVMFIAILLCAPVRSSLNRLQAGFVLLVLIYAVYAQLYGMRWGGRLAIGGMYDSNDMAALMAIAFPLAAGMLTRAAPGRHRIVAAAGALALGLGVIATGSRGGVIALLAGTIVFSLGFRGSRSVMVTSALMVAGMVGWITAPAEFRDRMRTLTNLEADYNVNDETGRKAVWERGRGYIKDRPVFGVGAGNFPIAEGGSLATMGRTGKWSAAHNAYVQAYAELGLIGGTIFVALLLLGAKRAIPMWRVAPSAAGRPPPLDRPELLGALAAFSASAVFLSHAYFPPIFVILGLIALADRVHGYEHPAAAAVFSSIVINEARLPGQRGGLAAAQPRAAKGRARATPAH